MHFYTFLAHRLYVDLKNEVSHDGIYLKFSTDLSTTLVGAG